MPAIQPARLRQQVLDLTNFIDSPGKFSEKLDDLLTFYADLVQRPGQSGKIKSLMTSYNVPSPVLRHIVSALKPFVNEKPEKLIDIINELWKSGFFEQKAIAAKLLGVYSVDPPDPIIEKFTEWALPDEDGEILNILFSEGLAGIRTKHPISLLNIFSEWLTSTQPGNMQILGLRGLFSLVADSNFENLPFVFKLLLPFLREPLVDIRPYLLDVLDKLALRSPQETVFLLQQALRTSDDPSTRWLARQTINNLPVEAQKQLREAMKI